ncbi:Uncharacterised protein [Klebsiella michiganensis]|nr:Uncharacterised protein [Klebsiella michiganensis]
MIFSSCRRKRTVDQRAVSALPGERVCFPVAHRCAIAPFGKYGGTIDDNLLSPDGWCEPREKRR